MGEGIAAFAVAMAVAVVLMVIIAAGTRRRRRGGSAHAERLFEAAIADDHDVLREAIRRHRSVDRTDRDGNTALHLAYYHGRQEAIDALVAFGADENLRNKEHLLPAEMREMAAIEELLTEGARCLGDRGDWLDVARGREIYRLLRDRKPRIFNPALVRRVLDGERQTQLLHLAIKLGVFGSAKKLAEILHAYGTAEMATDYLNAGSAVLREAAEAWAMRHGYTIHSTSGSRDLSWGRF